jgi:hypothetical protein
MDEQELSQLRVPVADENARPSEIVAQPPRAVPIRRQIERRLVIVAFVALWMALGWLLKLDGNAYLLLGVPLTAGFQILVARRPIRALWVRNAPRFRVDRTWLFTTGALAALPLYELSQGYRGGWVVIGGFFAPSSEPRRRRMPFRTGTAGPYGQCRSRWACLLSSRR